MTESNPLSFTERIIISFFDRKFQIYGKTKLQKYIFLLMKIHLPKDYFHFKAHRFGPFSDQINQSLYSLNKLNLIRERFHESDFGGYNSYILTDKGKELLGKWVDEDLIVKAKDILDKFGEMSYRELLTYVYEKYPKMTTNSIIKDKI